MKNLCMISNDIDPIIVIISMLIVAGMLVYHVKKNFRRTWWKKSREVVALRKDLRSQVHELTGDQRRSYLEALLERKTPDFQMEYENGKVKRAYFKGGVK